MQLCILKIMKYHIFYILPSFLETFESSLVDHLLYLHISFLIFAILVELSLSFLIMLALLSLQ